MLELVVIVRVARFASALSTVAPVGAAQPRNASDAIAAQRKRETFFIICLLWIGMKPV